MSEKQLLDEDELVDKISIRRALSWIHGREKIVLLRILGIIGEKSDIKSLASEMGLNRARVWEIYLRARWRLQQAYCCGIKPDYSPEIAWLFRADGEIRGSKKNNWIKHNCKNCGKPIFPRENDTYQAHRVRVYCSKYCRKNDLEKNGVKSE